MFSLTPDSAAAGPKESGSQNIYSQLHGCGSIMIEGQLLFSGWETSWKVLEGEVVTSWLPFATLRRLLTNIKIIYFFSFMSKWFKTQVLFSMLMETSPCRISAFRAATREQNKPCFINEYNLSQVCALPWILHLFLHPSVFPTPPSPSPTKERTLPPHLHTTTVGDLRPLTWGLPCLRPALMSSSVEGSITGRWRSATALYTGSVRSLHGLLGLGWCQCFHCL